MRLAELSSASDASALAPTAAAARGGAVRGATVRRGVGRANAKMKSTAAPAARIGNMTDAAFAIRSAPTSPARICAAQLKITGLLKVQRATDSRPQQTTKTATVLPRIALSSRQQPTLSR